MDNGVLEPWGDGMQDAEAKTQATPNSKHQTPNTRESSKPQAPNLRKASRIKIQALWEPFGIVLDRPVVTVTVVVIEGFYVEFS